MDGIEPIHTRGSPLGIGQPRANILDTSGVVSMRALRENQDLKIISREAGTLPNQSRMLRLRMW